MDTITNYKIKSELGQGGMATVYLAEDKKFLTNVAVKLLAKEYAHNDNIRKRFLAEARNMFKMSHPNIIKVTDLIDEGGTVAFVMEYIEGETLKDYLERKGKLSNDDIKAIFTQILAAVAYVHEQGLIHRDIKPSNFMINPKSQVKLLDFGIAKNTDTNSAEYTQTSTSQQMGTPMYMSPEQVNETKSVTSQSDIYSLGVVLWQMVMGKKPYDTKTLSNFQLQSKIVNEKLVLTNTIWDTSIQQATHKNLDNRYTSAQLFLNDLQNPESIKDNKTVFEKTDDKTIFENKEESTVIDNNKQKISDSFPLSKSLLIGEQKWMIQNLDLDRFRNGDPITEVKNGAEWIRAGESQQPAWCYYNNDSSNGIIFGKLYNWYAVNDPRGLAPKGWHIPSDAEWKTLINYLGGQEVAGAKMKSISDWKKTGNGTNTSGFSGLPGGYLYSNGVFYNIDAYGGWWSSSESNAKNAWYRYLFGNSGSVSRSNNNKQNGFSVRCLRD